MSESFNPIDPGEIVPYDLEFLLTRRENLLIELGVVEHAGAEVGQLLASHQINDHYGSSKGRFVSSCHSCRRIKNKWDEVRTQVGDIKRQINGANEAIKHFTKRR